MAVGPKGELHIETPTPVDEVMVMQEDPKHRPVSMQSYLDHFQTQSFWLIVLAQTIIISAIATIALVTKQYEVHSLAFWLMVGASFVIGISTHYILLLYMSRPAIDLVKAVVHVAGEQTTTTPPNPNSPRYSNNGFREILQTIYELSSAKAAAAAAAAAPVIQSETADILTQALADTPTGVIILNHERQVIYHNTKAPVYTDTHDQIVPELLFSGDTSLDEWLDNCEKHAVHAEHNWHKVANKTPGDVERKFYDITASYQKGSRAETVLTLFDNTDIYAPEEDDMDFIAFAAHELRGPITVIRGYLDVLDDELETVLKNDQSELLGRLIVSSNRLSSYVSNILNASRYDRQHLKFHVSEQQIKVAYDLIKDDMQLRAVAQNRLLIVNIPDDLPTVAVDPTSISEVLSNLMDNAIKYSNEGGQVLVTAKAVGKFVQVSIEDHGIGMPSNVIGNLFHKFYRSHRSRETVAGTGIGLYISKAIVEAHGGTIDVRSVENKGSTFTFSVPIFSTVADKIGDDENNNGRLVERGGGWIKNHSMYRG